VLVATILTLVLVIALTILAFISGDDDLNIIFGVGVVLIVSFGGFGILCLGKWNPTLYSLYCAIAVAVAGILLLIDTKIITGGKSDFDISLDDYVMGALILYADIMRIFLLVLRVVGISFD